VVFTPVSDAAKIIDTPQNQVAVHQQPPSPYQLHDDNWAATDEADLDAPGPASASVDMKHAIPTAAFLIFPLTSLRQTQSNLNTRFASQLKSSHQFAQTSISQTSNI
jgi:hypothetical protein